MKKPSFSKVNYLLRPNKNVERKVIVESLGGLRPAFNIKGYSYIGLGSMWFVDFVLIHKMLQIESMYSIEREYYAKRADFNRPYNCITVKAGDTSVVLPELELEKRPSILWLDYDSGIDGPVMEDGERVCEKAKSGSVFIITIDAKHTRLDDFSCDESLLSEKRMQALKHYAGDFFPPGLKHRDITKDYPAVLAKILFTKLKASLIAAGRAERFLPLYNLVYADTAKMLTIGGMIADETDQEKLDKCDLFERFPCVTGEDPFLINVPHLTFREKTEIDRMLPRNQALTTGEVDSEAELPLDKEEIQAYHRFYRYYPVFGELNY